MLRTINSPGIQINEIDRSQYDSMPDYSIVGTVCFICGFTDKGQNYTIKWINTINTLVNEYGYPQTEEEKYFWNACAEVLNKGGICLAAKIPYLNESLSTLPYVQYDINEPALGNTQDDPALSSLSSIDSSLTTYIEICQSQTQTSKYSGYITSEEYDRYCVNTINVPTNKIRIVGIENSKYDKADIAEVNSDGSVTWKTLECKGIMPILVSPINAAFFQRVISSETSVIADTINIYNYPYAETRSLQTVTRTDNKGNEYVSYAYDQQCISSNGVITALLSASGQRYTRIGINALTGGSYRLYDENGNVIPLFDGNASTYTLNVTDSNEKRLIPAYKEMAKIDVNAPTETTENIEAYNVIKDFDTVYDNRNREVTEGFNLNLMNFTIPLSSTTINDNTISKEAALQFPQIAHDDYYKLDAQQMKNIGLVVFKVMSDPATPTKLLFQAQESFIGQLDKFAKDKQGRSVFIDDVVNSQSKYVRLFSNISKAKTTWTYNDGRKLPYSATYHDVASFYYIKPQIGIVLGQYSSRCQKTITYQNIIKSLNMIFDKAKDKNRYQIDLVVDAGLANIAQAAFQYNNNIRNILSEEKLKTMQLVTSEDTIAWKNILNKYDAFCKYTRKDCMFIADGLRPFCLIGDQKLIRDTEFTSTIENNILPKLSLMSGINTSYGAGYCDWFLTRDAYSGNLIWLPPSIKAMGVYLYTDAYFNNWDAPAGLTRGVLNTTIDCAFSPNQEESGKLYTQCWNYACNYPIEGTVIEGQKTFQRQKTAFDRINVRRLFLYLERSVENIARRFVYEGNTSWQRQRFVDAITPIFQEAKEKNGILEYVIKCDEDNNTPNVIDNNELRCSIAVKPVKTIEFILLNFICTNQSATVEENLIL